MSEDLSIEPSASAPATQTQDTPPELQEMQALEVQDAPPPPPIHAPENRQRLIAQFERWLDRMAEGEPPPPGLAPEILAAAQAAPADRDGLESDLYTVFSALTTLSGEVRLQGRAFKQLAEALVSLSQLPGRFDRLEAVQSSISRELDRQAAERSQESTLPESQDVLAVIFDLRDRLGRGMQSLEESLAALQRREGAGGWRRLLGGARAGAASALTAVEGVKESYRLMLSRLDAALQQWAIAPVGAPGEAFDPERMTAVDIEVAKEFPDATILEVYRTGYAHRNRTLVTAQVKVSKIGSR